MANTASVIDQLRRAQPTAARIVVPPVASKTVAGLNLVQRIPAPPPTSSYGSKGGVETIGFDDSVKKVRLPIQGFTGDKTNRAPHPTGWAPASSIGFLSLRRNGAV